MDKIIDEWIESWKSGEKVPCEKLLSSGDLSSEQQLDLICMELLIRREQGDAPNLDEFVRRFPQFQRQLEAHFALEDFLSDEVDTQRMRSASIEENLEFLAERVDPIPDPSMAMEPSVEWAGRPFGDYLLLRVLGKGGMGLVFEARHVTLNRIVALKMMRGDWQNEKGRKQFKREAQAIAGLDFPHVVKILDAGEVNGSPYYTMNVMSGGSLAEHLSEYTQQTRPAVELVAIIARALSQVHRRGIVHRDIKHSNILMDGEKQPHISDFGLCRDLQLDPSTTIAHGNIVGTPMFLAPEQIETGYGKISPATDVYSLGVVLFHLVVGRPPFEGKSVMQVLWSSVHREPNFDDVPDPELSEILRCCLAKKGADRYADAGQLAEQLETWLGRNSGPPPMFRRMMRSLKQLKRKRGMLIGGVACLLMLFVAGSMFRSMTSHQIGSGLDRVSNEHKLVSDNGNRSRGIAENALSARDREAHKSNFLNRFEQRKQLALSESFVGDSEVLAVCFSFDSAYMAWSHSDGTIRIRHRPTSKDLDDASLKSDSHVWTMAFHPQRNMLAWGASDGIVTLFDVTTKTELKRFPVHRSGIGHVAFTRDGTHLICACAKRISTWSIDELLSTALERPDPTANEILSSNNFQTVAHLHPGDRIVSCGDDGFVRIWDWKNSLELLGQNVSNRSLHNVVVSPDGKSLAAGGADGVVRLLDAETLQPIHEYPFKQGSWIRGLAFSPDGKRLVSTSENGDIRMWSTFDSRELAYVANHTKRALDVAFAPDGQSFATAGDDNKCLVWNVNKIQEDGFLSVGESVIQSLSVGLKIAAVGCDDGQIRLFEPRSRKLLGEIKTEERSIMNLAISPAETVIASLGPESSLSVWDMSSHAVLGRAALGRATSGTTDSCGLTFSADGRSLGLASGEVVFLWGLHPFQEQRRIPMSPHVSSQIQSGLQHIACVSSDSGSPQLCLRNLSTLQEVQRFTGNVDDLRSIKFSTSGKKLAAIGADGNVKVWEIGVLSSPIELHSSQAALSCVDFAVDDEILAAGDANGYVRLYDLKSGKNSVTLHQGGTIADVAFTLDGDYLVGAGENGKVKIWDARPLTGELSIAR